MTITEIVKRNRLVKTPDLVAEIWNCLYSSLTPSLFEEEEENLAFRNGGMTHERV
jgi:hypothetical protein